MALDLTALNTYTNEQKQTLLVKAIASAPSVAKMSIAPGIKSKEKMNKIDTTVTFQAGGNCSFTALDTTSLSDREIEVKDIAIMEAICPKKLEKYYLQHQLVAGSKQETIPFEQEYSELKAALIADAMETAVWQGDTASSTANLNKFDGAIKILDAAGTAVATNVKPGTGTITTLTTSTAVTGVGSAFSVEVGVGDKIYSGTTLIGTVSVVGSATSITLAANAAAAVSGATFSVVPKNAYHFASPILDSAGIVAANVDSIIRGVYLGIPKALKRKPSVDVVCGIDTFETYIEKLYADNKYHYKHEEGGAFEITIPGTTRKLVGLEGLNGTNRVFAFDWSNPTYGTDLLNEEEEFSLKYAEEARELRFITEFKAGFQWAFPNEVVSFKGLK